MEWKDITSLVANVAPSIGSTLAGPAGGGIGLAVSALLRAFGLTSEAKPEDVSKLITTDPEAHLKLMIAEQDFQLKMREQDVEELKSRLNDIQNARQREVELTRMTGRREWNLYLTAWCVITGFFLLCFYLMRVKLPEGSNEVVFMLFGALASGFGAVLNYFFGSSKGSAEKTEILAIKK